MEELKLFIQAVKLHCVRSLSPKLNKLTKESHGGNTSKSVYFSQILFEKRVKLVPERSNLTER